MNELIVEDVTLLDEDKVYQAELIKVDKEPSGPYGSYLIFTFRLLNEPENPIVSGLCSDARLHQNTKLFKWLSIMNGSKFRTGDKTDPERFIGCVVELTIVNSEKDEMIYSNVSELLRLVTPA